MRGHFLNSGISFSVILVPLFYMRVVGEVILFSTYKALFSLGGKTFVLKCEFLKNVNLTFRVNVAKKFLLGNLIVSYRL